MSGDRPEAHQSQAAKLCQRREPEGPQLGRAGTKGVDPVIYDPASPRRFVGGAQLSARDPNFSWPLYFAGLGQDRLGRHGHPRTLQKIDSSEDPTTGPGATSLGLAGSSRSSADPGGSRKGKPRSGRRRAHVSTLASMIISIPQGIRLRAQATSAANGSSVQTRCRRRGDNWRRVATESGRVHPPRLGRHGASPGLAAIANGVALSPQSPVRE